MRNKYLILTYKRMYNVDVTLTTMLMKLNELYHLPTGFRQDPVMASEERHSCKWWDSRNGAIPKPHERLRSVETLATDDTNGSRKLKRRRFIIEQHFICDSRGNCRRIRHFKTICLQTGTTDE